MYVYVCAQKNEILTHLFMRIFLLVLFPDLHVVVIFYSSEFMCRVLFIYLLWALKFLVNSPSPPHTFVTHDETNQSNATNQAINKLEQIEQCVSYKTNEEQIGRILQYATN